jgi:MFS family permease
VIELTPPPLRLSSYDDNVLTGWRERLFVPTLVCLGLIVSMLSSLGAPLLPIIAAKNDVSLSTAQWMLTAALLAGAIASPIMGQLADGRRRRQVLIWAVATVLAGCIVAAAVPGFVALVIGRALQGVGLGLVPVAIVMARHHLPPRRQAPAIATLSITAVSGIGLGYPLTGLVAESFDYHVAFWAGGVLVAIALVLAILVLPSDHDGPPSHLDVRGAMLFSLSLVALLLAVSDGAVWGWGSPIIVGLFVAFLALGYWCIRYELRARRPLVVLTHLRLPIVVAADICSLLLGVALFTFTPIIVEFVQIPRSSGYGFGESAFIAGLCLVPMSAASAFASPIVRGFRVRYGPRVTLIVAQLLFVATMVFFAFRHDALWEAFVATGVAGLAIGMSSGTMPALIVGAVPKSEVGTAMALYQVVRNVGLTIGSAAGAAIIAANTAAHQSVPSVNAYRDVLLLAAACCVVLIPICLRFPNRSTAHTVSLLSEQPLTEGSAGQVSVAIAPARP